MKDDYLVTYYFSSGEEMDITYSKEKFNDLFTALKKGWNHACCANEEWGINFAQVTHYRVKIN